MSNYSEARDSLSEVHPYGLAYRADCAGPDATDSPGGDWLDTVRVSALESAGYLRDDGTLADDSARSDAAWEVADSAVPVYTHKRWLVFADLAAWREDVSELGYGESSDMTELAGVALYMIAERLAASILQELADAQGLDESESEDDSDL